MATKKFSLAALSLAFIFAACGGERISNGPSNNSSSESDIIANTFDDLPVCTNNREGATAYVKDENAAYTCINRNWVYVSETISIKDKSVTGVSQKGPFVTGSAVKLYELDGKTYAQTGKSFTGKITTDDGIFSVSNVTLASPYALLEANGYFRNEITGDKSSGTITLNALTDLSDREKVNINLLTHLEYERVLYLMGTGIDLSAAKKQAEAEILNAFGIKGDFENSEDLDIFSKGDGNAALLAFSVLMLGDLREEMEKSYETDNVAELTERLTKFAIDIEKDGIWDDEETKAKIADWAAEVDSWGGLTNIRNNIEKWELGSVPDFEKFVRNFWYINYGLGECGENNDTELKATINKYSKNYDTQAQLICKNGVWVIAQEIDFDTYGKQCSSKEVGKTINGVKTKTNNYYCTSNGWISLMDEWRWDIPKEARLNPEIDYGTMTDSRDKQTYKTVKIGNQVWMAENLNYADSATTTSLLERSWCYDDNAENCAVAGRLYTWAAAIDSVRLYDGGKGVDCGYGKTCSLPDTVYGICPPGWHLPTNSEWDILLDEIGGNSVASKVLKSQTGWYENGTDSMGFSAIPVGYMEDSKYYGGGATFWSATEGYSMCIAESDEYCIPHLSRIETYHGFSVRCLQN